MDVSELKLDQLAGPLVVVDVSQQAELDLDYEVLLSDINLWEEVHGRIPDGSFVFLFSAWGKRYPDKTRVFNCEDHTAFHKMHFPGFHAETTRFLIDQRKYEALERIVPQQILEEDFVVKWGLTVLLPQRI